MAPTRAMGNPVALEASAEDRDNPRVHLHDEQFAVFRIHRELDVASSGFDADLADNGDGGVAHRLILDVAERLGRRHRDRIAGVDAHRVEVLDRADHDHVVGGVAHHLELVLLPPDHAAIDEDLRDGRGVQSPAHQALELLRVVGDAAAGAAESEAGGG